MNHRFRQEQLLFDDALCLPESQRGAFLDAACGKDVELRRKVQDLLIAHTKNCLGVPGLPRIRTSRRR
ncbi:MAG: hypothetical protein QNJ14_09640 [Woeseiaceae bacterium]|nr:hypothetical protein [Woeseiaceae bacterium]